MGPRPDRPPHGSTSTAPWQRHERWIWVVLQRQHVPKWRGVVHQSAGDGGSAMLKVACFPLFSLAQDAERRQLQGHTMGYDHSVPKGWRTRAARPPHQKMGMHYWQQEEPVGRRRSCLSRRRGRPITGLNTIPPSTVGIPWYICCEGTPHPVA